MYLLLWYDGDHGDEEKKDHEPPKRGNTVYIHGHNITEEMIRRTFLNFGKIVNVNMEKDKKLVPDSCCRHYPRIFRVADIRNAPSLENFNPF